MDPKLSELREAESAKILPETVKSPLIATCPSESMIKVLLASLTIPPNGCIANKSFFEEIESVVKLLVISRVVIVAVPMTAR